MQKLSTIYLAIASCLFTTSALASDFSLPFVNSAGLGVAGGE